MWGGEKKVLPFFFFFFFEKPGHLTPFLYKIALRERTLFCNNIDYFSVVLSHKKTGMLRFLLIVLAGYFFNYYSLCKMLLNGSRNKCKGTGRT